MFRKLFGVTLAALAITALACESGQAPTSINNNPTFDQPAQPLEASPFEPGEASVFSNGLALASMGGCNITVGVDTWTLNADCTTTTGVVVPDTYTLDGQDHWIVGVDPVGGHFTGAVVTNGGSRANVVHTKVSVSGLADVCDTGADQLSGITFAGVTTGSIEQNVVTAINQGPSGCQEGHAILVRGPGTVTVAQNVIDDYQKSGIVADGADLDVTIENNEMGSSATQDNVAANGIQVSGGAIGTVDRNTVGGNQWLGPSNFVATGILTFGAGADLEVTRNEIVGNSDVGLFVISDNGLYERNEVYDIGPDGPHGDFGIADLFRSGNTYNRNVVCGFVFPFFPNPLPGEKNEAEAVCS